MQQRYSPHERGLLESELMDWCTSVGKIITKDWIIPKITTPLALLLGKNKSLQPWLIKYYIDRAITHGLGRIGKFFRGDVCLILLKKS